ncbi:hypothetical protein B0H21DRAFT_564151 [Amylocystis lapponica]|nr:hypothetical protein B0H21DRAFT_564151 [Amylocystis lapponica]
MYEDVCLCCGRPLSPDGRAYCSDECESIDATSPSISTTSSTYPSPFLPSANGANLADIPALVPSALGRSLNAAAYRGHQNRLSISSSSNSSAAWSAYADEEDEGASLALLAAAGEDECGYNPDLLGPDVGSSKSSGSYGPLLTSHRNPGLSYARRPSSTNNRSTIPLLHRRTSSVSDPPKSSGGTSGSAPAPFYEDDASDVPSASISSASSAQSHGRVLRRSRKSVGDAVSPEDENNAETVSAKTKRNRASLPAYFSLLTSSTSPSASRTQRFPSSLRTLTSLSRSLQSSPPTPRIANPILDPITAYAHAQTHARSSGVEATPRGRGRKREPNARSPSSNHRSPYRSPPRQPARAAPTSPPPRAYMHAHVGPQARARLDSVEKVFDWVSHSPVVNMQARGRTLTRRNSSPPAKPRFEMLLADADLDAGSEVVQEALVDSLRDATLDGGDDRERRRGRRRANELDGVRRSPEHRAAPGFGNGRSGLRARERERGWPMR